MPVSTKKKLTKIGDGFENIIFHGRWLLAVIYLGAMAVLGLYAAKCISEVWSLFVNFGHLTEAQLMIGVLSLLDMAMVGALVLIVAMGGYSIYIRRIDVTDRDSKPLWLQHLDATAIKTKIQLSLVGIVSIELLKCVIDIKSVSTESLIKLLSIFMCFVIAAVAMALTGKLMHPNGEPSEASSETPSTEKPTNEPG